MTYSKHVLNHDETLHAEVAALRARAEAAETRERGQRDRLLDADW